MVVFQNTKFDSIDGMSIGLTLVLILLKITHLINVDWLWVLMPLWIAIALGCCLNAINAILTWLVGKR